MEISLSELAELVGGEVLRAGPVDVFTGFGSLKEARRDEISFFGNERYAADFSSTGAGVIFVDRADIEGPEKASLIRVENPVTAFDRVIRKYATPKPAFSAGIHPSASVGDDVELDPQEVSIGANAVIEPGVRIGNGTSIGAGSVIGQGAVIGSDCDVRACVSVAYGCVLGDRVVLHGGVVVGGDGFGFQLADGRHQKIEQLGIVRIENDVEVGANTCIDRARFGETVIGEGTKIDNLVQIGHNCVIGKHCLIVAQTGLSGSVRVGDYVTLAAKSGIGGHIEIGERAVVAGDANVISDVPAGTTVFGYPARPMKEEMRSRMFQKKIPSLFDRVKKLEEGAAED